jgi:hypothetical protein
MIYLTKLKELELNIEKECSRHTFAHFTGNRTKTYAFVLNTTSVREFLVAILD